MTTDAHHPLAARNRDFLMPPGAAERLAAVRRARSHTKMVSRLRYVLPALATAALGLYFISPEIHISVGDLDASVAGVVIEKGNLRMVNPKLEGVNDKQGNYTVTAKYAEQKVSNPDLIHLTELQSEMLDASKGWSRLTAPKGRFETKTEQLELFGPIHVAQSSGMTALLTRADVDMKTQLVTSDEPVKVEFPDGTLDSKTMRIDMDTKRATFSGDVHVFLKQDKKETAAAAPAAEPAAAGLAGTLRNDAPVDIFAPRLTIYDDRKIAHFEGGVTTDQAGSRITSREMKVYYTSGDEGAEARPAQPVEGNANKLKWIDVTGDVRIVTQDGRRASSETLKYDALKQEIVLDQNVVLSQKGNVLKGRRMISNLQTGITLFPPLGRVNGHFEADEKPAAAPVASEPKPVAGSGQIDLSGSKGKPIDIEANSLTINDKERRALFQGKVRTVQGTMTMQSSRLNVFYAGGEEDTAGSGSRITSIRAEGTVLINTGEDQATTSDWAYYDAAKQTVTIGGNVVLSQGENVIKGDQLVIDLTTNRSRFVNQGDPSTRQRVRGLFMPQQSKPR